MVSTVAQICKQSWTSVVRATLIQSSVPSVPATVQGVIGLGHLRESMQAGAARFEHSSSNRTPIIGLDAALGLFECIDGGMQAVESRILGLTAHTIAGLERLGYPVVSPQGHGERSGIVCFKSHVEGQQRTTIKALPAAHQPPSPLQSAQQIVDELALHNI